MGFPQKQRMSVEQYLKFEDPTGLRYEYHDGVIVAMAGGTFYHSLIGANVVRALGTKLAGTGCLVLNGDIRIRIPAKSSYYYPDAAVVCGEPQFETNDASKTILLNPRMIIEVLSNSTEARDRGDKFSDYREIPSMRQYVLVSQTSPRVETYLRHDDGSWKFEPFLGHEAVVQLESLRINVVLSEFYEGVIFPESEDL